jgi:hypothetical protein
MSGGHIRNFIKIDILEIAYAEKSRERPLAKGREQKHYHDDDRHQNTKKNDLHGHRYQDLVFLGTVFFGEKLRPLARPPPLPRQ